MTTEAIEGEAREVGLTVIEPREMLNETISPEGTVALASRMATALKDIVERQHLYAVIQGKKFPQVEAWMTIARMDNVVCREVPHGITRHEDGSYEAEVELIRLSDGMVIGYGSALCGSKGDKPWDSRAEPARRSMAVTRATSRAFRQQYSWIMALAGYEPTPAEEMPRDDRGGPVNDRESEPENDAGETLSLLGEFSKVGRVARGDGDKSDCQFREEPDGWRIGFRLEFKGDKNIAQAIASGSIGAAVRLALAGKADEFVGQKAKVTGLLYEVRKPERQMYLRLIASAIETDEWKVPADLETVSEPMFPDEDEQAAIYEAEMAEAK